MKAKARYVRISPFKVRPVVDLVRGKDVSEATEILTLTHKKASSVIKKLIESAVANASLMEDIDVDTLFVGKIFVDEGPTWKRFRPRAMGRYNRIFKRTCHITVLLSER
jgi:large subunit ribosomal protein L22